MTKAFVIDFANEDISHLDRVATELYRLREQVSDLTLLQAAVLLKEGLLTLRKAQVLQEMVLSTLEVHFSSLHPDQRADLDELSRKALDYCAKTGKDLSLDLLIFELGVSLIRSKQCLSYLDGLSSLQPDQLTDEARLKLDRMTPTVVKYLRTLGETSPSLMELSSECDIPLWMSAVAVTFINEVLDAQIRVSISELGHPERKKLDHLARQILMTRRSSPKELTLLDLCEELGVSLTKIKRAIVYVEALGSASPHESFLSAKEAKELDQRTKEVLERFSGVRTLSMQEIALELKLPLYWAREIIRYYQQVSHTRFDFEQLEREKRSELLAVDQLAREIYHAYSQQRIRSLELGEVAIKFQLPLAEAWRAICFISERVEPVKSAVVETTTDRLSVEARKIDATAKAAVVQRAPSALGELRQARFGLADVQLKIEEEAEVFDLTKVEVTRGLVPEGDKLKFAVKVTNNSEFMIGDTSVTIIAPEGLDFTEPPSNMIRLGSIRPYGGFQSAIFRLIPLRCVYGELGGTVSFSDYRGEPHVIHIRPELVKSICPMLTGDMPTEIREKIFNLLKAGALSANREAVAFRGDFTAILSYLQTYLGHLLSVKEDVDHQACRAYLGFIGQTRYGDKLFATELHLITEGPSARGRLSVSAYSDDSSILVGFIRELFDELSPHLQFIERKEFSTDQRRVLQLAQVRGGQLTPETVVLELEGDIDHHKSVLESLAKAGMAIREKSLEGLIYYFPAFWRD